MFHKTEDSFSDSNGKNCYLFTDMSKEIKCFLYANVAFQPTAVHYSVIILVNTVHVCQQRLSEVIKYKEIGRYVLLPNRAITAAK